MDTKLTKKLKNHISDFLETHPPRRVSRHLRQMLFDYLQNCLKSGIPNYYYNLIWDLEDIFKLLDLAERELKKAKKEQNKSRRER